MIPHFIDHRPGETIVLEGMIGARTGLAIPATVVDVENGRDILACHVPSGVATLRLVGEQNAPLPRVLPPDAIERPDLSLQPRTWAGHHVLYLAPTDGRYAVHVRWMADWTFAGWYVNRQSPTIRLPDRWITEDQFLDIVVDPGRQWRWKDEDELAEAVEAGRLSATEARTIREAGEAIVPQIEAGTWPFDVTIAQWRPDPQWGLPAIPSGWEPTRR